MARGALRGAATAWIGLISLYLVGNNADSSGRVAEAFGWANSLIKRARDPDVAAIPDLSSGEAWGPADDRAGKTKAPPTGATGGISDRITNRVPIPAPATPN